MDDAGVVASRVERPGLNDLIDAMTEAVVITDMRMRILELNRTARSMLLNQEQGMELSLGDGEWEGSKLDALLQLSTGRSFEFRCNIGGRPCLATFVPVTAGEEISAVYCEIRETAPPPSNDGTLSVLMRVIGGIFLIMDRQGKITDCTPGATSLMASLGFENCRGMEFLEMVEKSHRMHFVEMFKRCQSEETAPPMTLQLTGRGDRSAVMQFTLSAIGSGQEAGFFLLRAEEQTCHADREALRMTGEQADSGAAGLMNDLLPFTDSATYFNVLAGRLSETAGADTVIIFGNAAGVISVMAQAACPPVITRRLLSRGYSFSFEAQLIRGGVPVVVDDRSPDFNAFSGLYRGYSSMILVPIKLGGENAGAIALLRRKQERIGQETAVFLGEVAAMVSGKLPTFRAIEEMRMLSTMHERLGNFQSRLEAGARQHVLYASIAREYRMLLHGSASYTFIEEPGTRTLVCVATDGKRHGRSMQSVPPFPVERLPDMPVTADKASARLGQALELPGWDSLTDAYIIPHSTGGRRGFTAILTANGAEPDWTELSVAERSRKHVDFILTEADRTASLEAACRRARLLNLVSEACISEPVLSDRLEQLMRYLTEAVSGSAATAYFVRDENIVSSRPYAGGSLSDAGQPLATPLKQRVIEAHRSMKTVQPGIPDDHGSPVALSGEQAFLLVPAGEEDGTGAVIALRIPGRRRLEYDEIEFAEFFSNLAVAHSRAQAEARRNDSEAAFASSLSSVLAGILSSSEDVSLPAAISS